METEKVVTPANTLLLAVAVAAVAAVAAVLVLLTLAAGVASAVLVLGVVPHDFLL